MISLSVFGHEGKTIYPIYISERVPTPPTDPAPHKIWAVDLSILVDVENNILKQHYVTIKDLAMLVSRATATAHKGRRFPCRRCLHVFSSEEVFLGHIPDCRGVGKYAQKTAMPEEGTKLKFTEYHKQLKVPFIIYADFECLNIPTNIRRGEGTVQLSSQEAYSFCYIIMRSDGQLSGPVIYVGTDAASILLQRLSDEVEKINERIRNPAPMVISEEQQIAYSLADTCCICNLSSQMRMNKQIIG